MGSVEVLHQLLADISGIIRILVALDPAKTLLLTETPDDRLRRRLHFPGDRIRKC